MNTNRESSSQDGIEAGLKVGGIIGVLVVLITVILGGKVAALSWIFGREVLYCAVIGLVCGATNSLGYAHDSARIGGIIGFIYAVLTFDLYQVVRGGAFGAAIGMLCAHALKRKRGQYSDIA